ncbi:hypothetical protein ACJMK2_021328, partial [Sinanodonta woodiana]
LLKQSFVFEDSNIVGYVQLLVDEDNNQLLVGARDSLFSLSLNDLQSLQNTSWQADDLTKKTCMHKGQTEYDCFNFVKVLLHHDHVRSGEPKDAVFACGTNAYRPTCTWRLANNLSEILEEVTGVGRTPYSPDYNSTAIITKDGNFYGATVIDITARDPAIYRSIGEKTHLRTVQYNSKWLNEPDFVSSYEIGEFVYFIFRESAVEYINCGKRIYSRIARVCKTDRGGGLLLNENWTTYFKARLNCSLPGEYPFYFDEIQSTFYLEEEEQLYAVFTTPESSIAGSAVCVYSLEAFNKSFTGDFKYQDSPRSAWERHVNSNPLTQCPVEKDTSKRSFVDEEGENKQSIMAQKYQMMDNSVQPMATTPLLVGLNERWTHVVVDNILGKNGVMYKVLFVTTDDGKLKKMLQLPNVENACLIEEIKIVPNGEPKPVKAMKLYAKDGSIFISTFQHILKFPVHRCDRFKDIDLCLNAKDPYCGWNTVEGKCGPPPSNQPSVHFWMQSIDGCPIVEHPVDGGWSNWTEWTKCTQVGGDPTTGDCLCRSRSCDNPRPVFGGRKCYGHSIEVTNCTTHGQWTAWSEWSQCSQSCGSTAVQWRQRYCSNPPPRFGGRECMGDHKEEEYCKGQKPCPTPPIQSNWTQWTEWTQCTSNCNGGIQNRRRSCVEPPPGQEQKPCLGNQQEWRMCNTFVCEDIDKMTPWTPWVVTNRTKGGYFQERFRFVCRASVPSQDLIKTQLMNSPTQFCLNNGGSCYDSGEIGRTIDTFSPIDRYLRKYCKHRKRLFKQFCKCRTLGIFLVCQKCSLG